MAVLKNQALHSSLFNDVISKGNQFSQIHPISEQPSVYGYIDISCTSNVFKHNLYPMNSSHMAKLIYHALPSQLYSGVISRNLQG